MSEENVEIVRRAIAYEIYGVGDRAEAEAIFDPQVVINPTEEGPSHAWMQFGTTSSTGRTRGKNSK
jgi:hypothetical protein